MASAIGLRVYQISVHRKRNPKPLGLTSGDLPIDVPTFITEFVKRHNNSTQNDEMERSWYFEAKDEDGPGNNKGYVHYGTFGFESNFVDTKTKKRNYRRRTTDVEEIPLFYEFWCPENSSFGFAAFQSFQGRSCITLVTSKLREDFEERNKGFTLSFQKILPNDVRGSAYYSAPVKHLRLIKRKTKGDIADRYFDEGSPDEIDLEIVMSARRKESLGALGSLLGSVKSSERSVLTYRGIEFPEAVAEVRVGKKIRRVGVLGINSDAGAIDLTDSIKRGPDGHPTYESLRHETSNILLDFYDTVRKRGA